MSEQSTERPVVFVSWSGAASEKAAIAIKEWLENVFPTIDAFFSTHDIPKGTRGEARIALQLERAIFGVLCLTPVSQTSRWVLYEAGALTGQLEDERVSPLLLGVKQSEVLPPLSSLQSTEPAAVDMQRLALRINAVTPKPLPDERITRVLPLHWGQLEPKLVEAIGAARSESDASGISAKRTSEDMFEEIVTALRRIETAMRPSAISRFFADPERARGARAALAAISADQPLSAEVQKIMDPRTTPEDLEEITRGILADREARLSEVAAMVAAKDKPTDRK